MQKFIGIFKDLIYTDFMTGHGDSSEINVDL